MKRITNLTQISLFLFGLSTSAIASAAVANPMGWYVDGNVGRSYAHSNVNSTVETKINDEGVGWNINAGYRFLPYLGGEIGYTKYADSTLKTSTGIRVYTDQHYSYDIAAKAIWPLAATGIEVFLKGGFAHVNSSLQFDNNNTDFVSRSKTESVNSGYYAGGLDYAFSPELLGTIQYAQAQGNSDTGTLDLASVGVTFIIN